MILTVSIMAFILFNISRNMSKQAAKEMSQMSKIDTDNKSKRLTFSDVAGNEEAKEALMDMVDFIKNPEAYNNLGARLPREYFYMALQVQVKHY